MFKNTKVASTKATKTAQPKKSAQPIVGKGSLVPTPRPTMPKLASNTGFIMTELKLPDGRLLGAMSAPYKNFKTGSVGYYANGKLEIDGKRYQVQLQFVEIGSKPK